MENPSSFGLGTGISSQKSRRSSGLTCCFIKNLGKSRSDLPAGLLSSAENIPSHPTMSLLTCIIQKKYKCRSIEMCIHLSFHPPIPSTYLPIHPSIHPSNLSINLSIKLNLSNDLPANLSVYASVYLSFYLSIVLSF